MVWAELENGGFWPAIICRTSREVFNGTTKVKESGSWFRSKPASIGSEEKEPQEIPEVHVQYVCPPFLRYDGETVKSRWVNAISGCVAFECLSDKGRKGIFYSNRIRCAYE